MTRLALALATVLLTTSGSFAQDVPQQQPPGTNSPDVGKQRQSGSKSNHDTSQQGKADVPNQEPGSNSPDVSKQQRQKAPKKTKRSKSTASSTT